MASTTCKIKITNLNFAQPNGIYGHIILKY